MTFAYSLNTLACSLNTLAYSLNTLAYMLNTFARCHMVLIALGVVRALGGPLFLHWPSTYYIGEKFFGPGRKHYLFFIIAVGF